MSPFLVNKFLQERTYSCLAFLSTHLNKLPHYYLTFSSSIWNYCFISFCFFCCKLKYAFSSVPQSAYLLQYLVKYTMLDAKGTLVIKAWKVIPPNISVRKNVPILYKVTTIIESCGGLFVCLHLGRPRSRVNKRVNWRLCPRYHHKPVPLTLQEEEESMLRLNSNTW